MRFGRPPSFCRRIGAPDGHHDDDVTGLERIGLGGGCHWCTEAVFQQLRSVSAVEQGFIRSLSPHEAPAEAVLISFDGDTLPLEALLEVHLRTHSSSSRHKLRGKYRSAVYTFDEHQAERVRTALHTLQAHFDRPLVTQALPFGSFEPSPPQYQNYYARNSERAFCRTYIEPKLTLLRERFAAAVQT